VCAKLAEKYTIMVCPKDSPTMRTYHVTGRLIKTLVSSVITLAVILIAGGAGIYFYLETKPDSAEVQTLRSDNAGLKNDLIRANQKINLIQHKLATVENFEMQLRRLTQINDPARKLAMGPVSEEEFLASLGTAASSGRFNEALVLKLEETFGVSDPDEMMGRLDELLGSADDAELKLAELSAYVREQKFVLSHTPSIWPVRGWVTSSYGRRVNPFTHAQQFHEGIDISNAAGTPIVAPADGVVVYVGDREGYGKTLVIDHGADIQTVYAHNSEIWVSVGDTVTRGQKVTALGSTGRSTGPHLHYEVRVHGITRNPMHYIIE